MLIQSARSQVYSTQSVIADGEHSFCFMVSNPIHTLQMLQFPVSHQFPACECRAFNKEMSRMLTIE